MPDLHEYGLRPSSAGSSMEQYAIPNDGGGERHDLARELHDTVIQPLTSLVMSFTCLERRPPGAEYTEAHLVLWKRLAQEALDSLRSTLAGFRSSLHAGWGLSEALHRSLAPQLGSRGMRLNIESHDWPIDIPPDWNWNLYLAVREALTNVEKHASATEVWVHLHAEVDSLSITVIDDGIGFRSDELARKRFAGPGCGLGIDSIRDRLSMLGGRLDITTAPGCGVRLEMQLPRPQHAGTEAATDTDGFPTVERAGVHRIH
jgi:signal transduction histidine kinase